MTDVSGLHPAGPLLTRESVAADLRALGLEPGGVVLVHAAMGSLGWVCGGATAVVQALLDVLGADGTLVVPTFTSDNRDPSRWREPAVPEAWWPAVREALPAFDPTISPGHRMGAISEQVRTWPGAVRSTHPQTSFAAVGPAARRVVDGHALDCHLGEQSPLARLEELGADVLLLGVGWARCTAFHLAEYRQPDPPRRTYSCVVTTPGTGSGSGRGWVSFEDVDLHDDDFARLGEDFEAAHGGGAEPAGALATGRVGGGECRRFPLADAVRFAGEWMPGHRPAARREVDAAMASRPVKSM